MRERAGHFAIHIDADHLGDRVTPVSAALTVSTALNIDDI